MPTQAEHIKKACENERFADSLGTSTQASLNWKLVVLFYAAVHFVEAYLAKYLNQHLRSHITRDNYVSKESNLRQIRMQYGHLKFYGYNARYEPDQFVANDVKDALSDLAAIKGKIQPLL